MTGARIRHARVGQQRSLADVAGKADISVATLSRIENNKQALDIELFLRLARILRVAASDLLSDGDAPEPGDTLARRLADLRPSERTKLWHDLAIARRQNQRPSRRPHGEQLASHVDELLAQIEFLRSELEAIRRRIRREPLKRARA